MAKAKLKLNMKTAAKKFENAVIPTGALTLPTEYTKPSDNLMDYTWLIYGERKIGKTSLTGEFRDAFHMMIEPGGRGLKLRAVEPKNWEEVVKYVSLLEKNPKYCSTVIIDTGRAFYDMCMEHALRVHDVTDPREKAWGAVWTLVSQEFSRVHAKIFKAGLGFAVTGHSTVREIELLNGAKIDKVIPDMSGSAFRYYCGIVDIIAYYSYNANGDRELIIRGNASLEAGCRIKNHFNTPSGKPLTKISMGNSEAEAYANIVKAFNNELEEPGITKKKTIIGSKKKG